jgi:Trypsin-like serine proteases, typically periplasmic, contain C-terminal PDZ domain
MKFNLKSFLIGVSLVVILVVAAAGGAIADRLFVIKPLDFFVKRAQDTRLPSLGNASQKFVNEESVVIDVAENMSPSVVTVSIQTPRRRVLQLNPFGGFSSRMEGGQPQDIGSGFIVSEDGLIVTNKHVVSEPNASYKVITKDGKEYPVKEISKDPSNDIAIVKIDAKGLKPVNLGDSGNLKVGQFVIAIGTALGEFRHTVTTGVISGLGRGITAGSAYEGFVEELDNVIQTDAAINPGNSGGPLLNSQGQAIGINVAIAQGAQNVGFAIPINVVKDSLLQFNKNGKFLAKAYLGVQFQMVKKQSAVLNNVPEGAYVEDVVAGSPADKAGVQVDDIITKIDGAALNEANPLSKEISKKKPGDTVKLDIYRDNENKTISVILSEAPNQ